jgi:5'-methylthioadenosine phosphorylase
MWAVIGGSGFENFEGFETVSTLVLETPFGMPSSTLKKVRVKIQKTSAQTLEILFLSRHGENHELLPSEINYRANIFALKQAGATAIISFSAVGSMRSEIAPGDLVIPLQYLDRTKGIRRHTFCGEGVVGHVSLAHPVCEPLARKVGELLGGAPFKTHMGGSYVCIEGPHFSTLAESLTYRDLAADIIGMTNFPEYALAREAGLIYLPCCFVTDYDCWDTSRPHVTLEEVVTVMRQNNSKAYFLLTTLLSAQQGPLLADCDCARQGLAARGAVLTPLDRLSPAQRDWLGILMSRN